MPEAHVVVVEDDETLSQFFSMVLDLMPVTHQVFGDAESALDALRDRAADVVVTDLLLPGLGGRGLIQALMGQPQWRRQASLVVMSGSIDDTVRRELQALGVWRVLAKPATVKTFQECIQEALAHRLTVTGAAEASAPPPPGTTQPSPLAPWEQAAVQRHFAGREALFRAYRDACLAQLPLDLATGDAALSQHDTPSLRRMAHNLKTVLRSLGRDAGADLAQELEDLASRPTQPQALEPAWASLRACLQDLTASTPALAWPQATPSMVPPGPSAP